MGSNGKGEGSIFTKEYKEITFKKFLLNYSARKAITCVEGRLKFVQIMVLCGRTGPKWEGSSFYIEKYREKSLKIYFSKTNQPIML